jgi:riboflavin kinase/FMN adenylyltransferase
LQVHKDIKNLPKFRRPVLTIGTYDGVHLGHQYILQRISEIAKAIDGESILLTFDPHPRSVLQPNVPLYLISTLDEKIKLLEKQNIDHVVVIPFDKNFADIDAIDYIKKVLVDNFNPEYIVIGYDHHFGKNRSGDIHILEKYSTDYKYKVEEISAQTIDDIKVSSTKVRNALLLGDIKTANHLLIHPFSISGVVIHGDKIGRTLGFPTANISYPSNKLIPAIGVYLVKVDIDNQLYKGALSISKRPAVIENGELRVEVYILDFDNDIYGKSIEVILFDKIRDDKNFDSLSSLKEQIQKDVDFVRDTIF